MRKAGATKMPTRAFRALLLAMLAVTMAHVALAGEGVVSPGAAVAEAAPESDPVSEEQLSAPAISAVYNCSAPTASDTLVDSKYLAYCTPALRDSPVAARVALLALLGVMLYLLSSTADSFFCPVLQAIVEKYQVPPDLAGVTFLTFGNGSPDVFSNIAAFSSSSPSIGVTSILGGGLLVSTVIVACVGLVSEGQEQIIPRKYARDVVFYLVSVVYLCVVFFDGVVHLPEAIGFLVIYCCFVLAVFLDKKLAPWCSPSCLETPPPDEFFADDAGDATNGFTSEEYLSVDSPSLSESSHSETSAPSYAAVGGFNRPPGTSSPFSRRQLWKPSDYDVFRIPVASDSEQSEASPVPSSLPRKWSAPAPHSERMRFRQDYHRPGNAQEQQSLLERTDLYLKRPTSMCVSSMRDTRHRLRRRKSHTAWNAFESSAHAAANARRWTRSYHQLSRIAEASNYGEDDVDLNDQEVMSDIEERQEDEKLPWETKADDLFADNLARPDLSRWKRWPMVVLRTIYSAFDYYLWTPFEFTTVFIRRLSIPLVDEDTWDKNFAIVCPPFAMLVFGTSVLQLSIGDPWFLGSIIGVGGFLGAVVDHTTSSLVPPSSWQLAPFIFVGFVMSVVWIMNIANELLGVLETLGELFGISNAVLGVSVLAWGNSIGDLVSNTSIARDGFPTMAFAGCFAGPMFNLLVGIGLSLTIAIISRGPISMGEPSPLIYLGFGYLMASLVLNLFACSYDKFRYRAALCYSLLILYASFAVISIVVVAADDSH